MSDASGMRTRGSIFLGVLLAGAGVLPAQERILSIQPTPWGLALAGAAQGSQAPTVPAPVLKHVRLAGAATVEVWEENPAWELRENLRLFQASLLPELRERFRLGTASSTGSQMLSEFMTMGWAVRPPAVPSVYYNCLTPTEDPYLALQGIHFVTTGQAPVMANARRR